MKRFSIAFFVILVIMGSRVNAQGPDENVISYYAVTNSVDGQPMIGMMNVLRFYPVFAMRSMIDSVNVTVYSGANVYTRPAHEFDSGRYWEVLLPKFNLGDAIQRLEVETVFRLKDDYQREFKLIKSFDSMYEANLDSINKELSLSDFEYDSLRKNFGAEMIRNNGEFHALGIESAAANKLRVQYEQSVPAYYAFIDSAYAALPDSVRLKINSLTIERSRLLRSYLTNYETYRSTAEANQATVVQLRGQMTSFRDSLVHKLTQEVQVGLTDSSYIGPSVQASDLVIDPEFRTARVLYRNYKGSLRKMLSIDPAERMGIFRIRYVPFPIVGTDENPRMNLKRPLAKGSPTVFEVGLAFGDAIVPGDEFVAPQFSWQRLGIAFAITQELFSDSAQVIAVALTYDFNSYGSVGVGANFAGKAAHGYMSFGINKSAFDQLIKGISGIF